jgi:aryl-alcohol dehydrogenase-like predicted oxidoreductase
MGMTRPDGPAGEQEGIASIRRAHELGVTFFDTAELYGQGTDEGQDLLGDGTARFGVDEDSVAVEHHPGLPRVRHAVACGVRH